MEFTKDYKIIFIPFSYDGFMENSGSERLRCKWLAPYLNADIYNGSQDLENYDVIIYQKAFVKGRELAKRYKHKFQIFDICDPIWLFYPKEYEEMKSLCNVITASSWDIAKKTGGYYVPDRLDFKYFQGVKKEHKDKLIRAVWFGYAGNFHFIKDFIPELERLEIPLSVISNKPVGYGKWIQWIEKYWLKDIIGEGDLVINPKIKYKSNNKTITAWALNMPVAQIPHDIIRFSLYEERIKAIPKDLSKWDIKKSVEQIYEIIKNNSTS